MTIPPRRRIHSRPSRPRAETDDELDSLKSTAIFAAEMILLIGTVSLIGWIFV